MKNRVVVILLIIFIILQFLVYKLNFGILIYSILIMPLAIYFFPIKPFLEIIKKKYDLKTALYVLFSCFIICSILCFSIITFIFEIKVLYYASKVFFLLNAIIFYYELFKSDNKFNAFLHFLVMCFYNYQ